MDNKSSDSIGNICTILGGVLLGIAIVDQATKNIIPEMEKLTPSEALQNLKLLPSKQEKPQYKEESKQREYDTDSKKHDDEIVELKRKLAEYESKTEDHKDES